VAQKTERIDDLWLRRFHPADDPALRLVCFPHAGGSATYYFQVSRVLAQHVEVMAVQYPGRQDRRTEACVDDIGVLADDLAERLSSWTDRPIALFGHSMGSTLAYEVARRMERAGTAPLGLFASGGRAPSACRDEGIHERDDEGLVAAIAELSGTDSAVLGDEEFLRMVMPVLRSDYKAVETYRHLPGPELSCPVHVLVGGDDPVTTLDEAEAWRAHTTAEFELEVFPGGHFYLVAEAANVHRTIVRKLKEWSANPPEAAAAVALGVRGRPA